MTLNARKVKGGGGDRVEQPLLDEGTYPIRLVQIIDLGRQTQRPYQGQAKPPVQMIRLTYELLDEFCVDKDGNIDEERPRWISEDIPFHNLEADKAKSTQRYLALDPKQVHEGDWTELAAAPGLLTITNNESKGKTYNNVGSLSAMRAKDVANAPELVNPVAIFVLDDPDLEVFNKLPQFVREKITSNLDYEGSALEALLEGGDAPTKEEAPKKKTAKAAPKKAAEEDEGDDDDSEW